MTKEEMYDWCCADTETKIVIDKIYDDFEDKICDNCKYIKKDKYNLRYCCCPTSPLSSTNQALHPTFGCNRWEQK